MPKKARELAPLEVKRLTKPGLHAVGGVAGLHMQVNKNGARSWIMRASVGGRRRDIGLGGFPDVTLADAREKARHTRTAIEQGIDPVQTRKESRSVLQAKRAAEITFDEAARKFMEAKSVEWKNAKHKWQWETTLASFASPVIGSLHIGDVTMTHVTKILEPIWSEKTETATRVRGRLEKVFDWAIARGYRQDNPARWKGLLAEILPSPHKIRKVEHHRALPVAEISAYVIALRKKEGITPRALEFLILTAARSGEVRGATWSEIDLKAAMWTIPDERMKKGKEHRVPLSPDAVKLLKALPRFAGNDHVFPAPRGNGVLSDMALIKMTRDMGDQCTPHGFRSTFRDWCAENTNYPREAAEHALAHGIPDKTERAYYRSDLFVKRIALMAEWARYCSKVQGEKAKVLSIRARK